MAKLAQKPLHALQGCKRLMKHAFRQPTQEAFDFEAEQFAARVISPEARAIFDAFLAKRQQAHHS